MDLKCIWSNKKCTRQKRWKAAEQVLQNTDNTCLSQSAFYVGIDGRTINISLSCTSNACTSGHERNLFANQSLCLATNSATVANWSGAFTKTWMLNDDHPRCIPRDAVLLGYSHSTSRDTLVVQKRIYPQKLTDAHSAFTLTFWKKRSWGKFPHLWSCLWIRKCIASAKKSSFLIQFSGKIWDLPVV